MAVEIISNQSPQKYGTGPESSLRPLDLQSETLPTALWSPVSKQTIQTQDLFSGHILI